MAEHRINHLEVELRTTSAPVARAVSERLGQIHGRRVAPVLDRVCSELAAGDELVRLDRLEVDLGTLPVDGFEDEFVDRLEHALRAALIQALRGRGDGDRRAAAALEVVETFALTGGLPWWAPADDGVVGRHFALAALAAQGELLAVLRRIAVDPGAIDRLARLCDPDALAALVGRVHGGDPRQVRVGDATERGALLRSLAAPPVPRREPTGAADRPPAGRAHEPAAPRDAADTATVRHPSAPTARGDRAGAAAADRAAPAGVDPRGVEREPEAPPQPGAAPLHRGAGAATAEAGSRSPPAERDDAAPRDAASRDAASRDAAARDATRHASPIDRETAAHREPAEAAAPAPRVDTDGRAAIGAEPDAPVAPDRPVTPAHQPAAPPALAAPGPAIAHAARPSRRFARRQTESTHFVDLWRSANLHSAFCCLNGELPFWSGSPSIANGMVLFARHPPAIPSEVLIASVTAGNCGSTFVPLDQTTPRH